MKFHQKNTSNRKGHSPIMTKILLNNLYNAILIEIISTVVDNRQSTIDNRRQEPQHKEPIKMKRSLADPHWRGRIVGLSARTVSTGQYYCRKNNSSNEIDLGRRLPIDWHQRQKTPYRAMLWQSCNHCTASISARRIMSTATVG
jgi:hypothetical protein